ncbi:universal stress protein [Natrinema thermotolerans]|uniref:Universal stress protein n=1 Tax=Natrinema thermotolerans TaxID=121872 RepID=A0AAF0P9U8_9EURY|nr:universal stress protein [Natrinema thermotolerans]QCC60050.1 universal stress protein [Natrinema thermotolerans]QCC60974.1 universal stress protein [Natrinema thermotolerans]WMT07056.1 universal stress protein [Natrinema thermotolerans]
MQYLVGTDSVHTTAAICDYLEERANGDDAVTVVAVAPADDPTARRDCEEALNVAPVRLATVGEVETEVRTGSPVAELRDAATASAADELVVGAHSGDPDATRDLGSTTRGLLADADRPVVVVPIPDL